LIRSPDRPARSESLYRHDLSWPTLRLNLSQLTESPGLSIARCFVGLLTDQLHRRILHHSFSIFTHRSNHFSKGG
jgi:hypothetical protein